MRVLCMVERVLIHASFLGKPFIGGIMVLERNTVVLFDKCVHKTLRFAAVVSWSRCSGRHQGGSAPTHTILFEDDL